MYKYTPAKKNKKKTAHRFRFQLNKAKACSTVIRGKCNNNLNELEACPLSWIISLFSFYFGLQFLNPLALRFTWTIQLSSDKFAFKTHFNDFD